MKDKRGQRVLPPARHLSAFCLAPSPFILYPSSFILSSMSILSELKERFRLALAGLAGDSEELLSMIRRSQDPKFGDYQANLAMPLGKRLGRPPREVAAELLGRLDVADLCEPPEIAGPGFINLRLRERGSSSG